MTRQQQQSVVQKAVRSRKGIRQTQGLGVCSEDERRSMRYGWARRDSDSGGAQGVAGHPKAGLAGVARRSLDQPRLPPHCTSRWFHPVNCSLRVVRQSQPPWPEPPSIAMCDAGLTPNSLLAATNAPCHV